MSGWPGEPETQKADVSMLCRGVDRRIRQGPAPSGPDQEVCIECRCRISASLRASADPSVYPGIGKASEKERKNLREGKDQGGESSTDDEAKRSQRSVKPRRTPPRSPVRTRGQTENNNTPEPKEKATPQETGAVKKAPRDEQQLWRYCKDVLRQMTEATDRQKNISMDVKKGLARLQEAMDRLQRIRRKNPELQSRSVQTEWVVEKLKQKTQATQVTPGKVAAVVAKPGKGSAKPQAAQVVPTPPKRAARPPVKITKAGGTQKKILGDTNTEERAKGEELGWTKTQSRRARRKARKGEKTAASKQGQRKKETARPKKAKPEAILIKPTEGRSYAQVLGELRQKVNTAESKTDIMTVRRTRAGDVLIELDTKATGGAQLCESLRGAFAGSATVRTLKPKVTVEIRDLDCLTTEEEVKVAIREIIGNIPDDHRVSLTRANTRGQKIAILELEEKEAEQLIKAGRVKIGFTCARIRRRVMVTRCFACFGYGHQQAQCKGPNRYKEGICIRCGEKGHIRKDCKATPKCCLCAERKMPAGQLGHTPGTGNLHRSRAADALLDQLRVEYDAALILISEQYRNRDGPGWYSDLLGTAALWTTSPAVVVGQWDAGEGFVWARCGRVTYVSCYFTPNENIYEFRRKMDGLEDAVRDFTGPLVVAGDFNAKALEWGSVTTDPRGRYVLEMAARLGLAVANVGNTSTFRRLGNAQTIPDITLVTDGLAGDITGWRVIEDYTGSDHQYITFSVGREVQQPVRDRGQTVGWNANKMKEQDLSRVIGEGKEAVLRAHTSAAIVDGTMQLIQRACDQSMPRKRPPHGRKKAVYWWTEEIADLRRQCLRLRRVATRARRRNEEMAAEAHEEFRLARRNLKQTIYRSKKAKWEELRQSVDTDPWGLGYKIVMRKLGSYSPRPSMDANQMGHIVDTLFPSFPERVEQAEQEMPEEIPPFTAEELEQAVASLQGGKAPGPDGVPAEALKAIVRSHPDMLLHLYNSCLTEGVFPRIWKVQRLVLINKGKGDPDSPSAYRPLCMLDTPGKLLERLLKPRIAEAVQQAGGLSERQYGFRKGRSTVGAIGEVVSAVEAAQRGNHYSRRIVLLATLDVRNAFNSARWSDILDALTDVFKIPDYLLRMVKSYLSDRELLYDSTDGTHSKRITGGAAQGSILGPDLWNISYDGILKMEVPRNTFLVGYADDIAAVVVARDIEEAQNGLNQVMRRAGAWLEDHGLSLAREKTELLLLTKQRIPAAIPFQVEDEEMEVKAVVKYLGVRLDTKLTFWAQIQHAAEAASKVTTALSRLMANVGGPTAKKRRLLMSVTDSIILYGCEIWADALQKEKYRKVVASVQRRGALRIASAYRTVSEPAVLVIAGVMPIDLRATERKTAYSTKEEVGAKEAKARARIQAMQRWQERWREETGRTARLIPNLKYDSTCIYEEFTVDDAYHTFFECTRFDAERRVLEGQIGHLDPDTIVEAMIRSQDVWNKVEVFVRAVLLLKKPELDRHIEG
ncbi:hypothetical protein NQ317_003188 [Molorchus minor]|uniref:Reverse transcriptase n=1 Tax=Molorchus minor TaxID=1323400 RepID=A0ABQ9JJ13_9CUCU|nr:hypothetical protein NQ317_003188 [Molorchus minor]